MESNLDMGREFNWDDVIPKEEFIVLPECDCDFEIVSFERGRHNGSEKVPPCPKAVLKIKVKNEAGQRAIITHSLLLHSRCQGLLRAFAKSIGQCKGNEEFHMNWNAVVGSRGRCKVGIRTWQSRTGEEMKSNEIKRFYEPEGTASQPPAPPAQTAQTAPAPQQASFGGGFAGGFSGGFVRR